MQILLVEDNPSDAELVRTFLEDGLKAPFVMEQARRLSTGLRRIVRGGIDVVLLDLGLPDCNGLATFQRFHAQGNGVPIVVLSAMDEENIALEAVRLGAQDYLVKGKTNEEMISRALRFAIERAEQFKKHEKDRAGITNKIQSITEHLAKLSPRETEVLEQIAEGKSLKQIAATLKISYNTVRNQRASILEKMEAVSGEDLVRMVLTTRFGRES